MERRRTQDSSKKAYESSVLPFAERVMWKDPALQPAKLRSSWGYGCGWGRSQTSNGHFIGTRVGIFVARTIRRLPASERQDSNLVVAMRGTPVAGRPDDAAADDAPTVTRHAVEMREVIVVPAISGAPLQAGSEDVSAPSNPVPNLPKPTVARAQPPYRLQWKAIIQVERELTVHALVEKHDESLVPKRLRGRPATHCWPSPGSAEHSCLSRLRRTQLQTFAEMSTENVLSWVSLHQAVHVTSEMMSS